MSNEPFEDGIEFWEDGGFIKIHYFPTPEQISGLRAENEFEIALDTLHTKTLSHLR